MVARPRHQALSEEKYAKSTRFHFGGQLAQLVDANAVCFLIKIANIQTLDQCP